MSHCSHTWEQGRQFGVWTLQLCTHEGCMAVRTIRPGSEGRPPVAQVYEEPKAA